MDEWTNELMRYVFSFFSFYFLFLVFSLHFPVMHDWDLIPASL